MTDLLNDHVVIDGHRIACGTHGAGDPLVLIHGTPSHSFIWRKVVPRLTDAGYRVHLFDLLGFGASERPRDPAVDTSVAAQDTVLTTLMRYWGLESAHIVSHDIGGAIGLRFGLFHPEMTRTLTVIDTVSYDSWPSVTWRKIIAEGLDELSRAPDAVHRDRFAKQLRMVVHDKAIMQGDVLASYLDAVSGPIGQPSFFQHQVRHYHSRYTSEISDRLTTLGNSLPVQILWGETDEWQPVDWAHRLAADIPGSALHVIPEAGHFAMEDKPDAVAALVVEFAGAARR
ncbi:MAG: alpha/beta hydrolase [Alphaproteobacteria bacterium]|nr:alpha/beta hydrolase [Alphaproteobacteria bacterium]